MRRFFVWMAAGVLAGSAVPTALDAQGYGIYEHGTCVMARAGTGTASPCADGSAIFFNPAGILGSGARGTLSGGVTYIGPKGSFTNDVTNEATVLEDLKFYIPHLYYARDLGNGFAGGIGVFAPYGLTTEWPTTFEGRFLGYRSEIQGVYIQPTFAAQVTSTIKLGVGFDISMVKVNLRQRADLWSTTLAPGVTGGNLGFAEGTDFADIDLEGHASGVGFNIGAIWQAHPRVALGVRYLSQQEIYVNKADATIEQISTGIILDAGNPLGVPGGTPLDLVLAGRFMPDSLLDDQTGSTHLTFPDQLVFGVTVKATDKLNILTDVQFVRWSHFDELALQFERLPQKILREDYENTVGFRFGAEYAVNQNYTARAGFLSHGAAAPDQTVTPSLPEGPRSEITAGLGATLTPKLHVDVAYQYIDQADRRGRSRDGGLAAPTSAINNGLYTFSAHLFAATFTYKF
jgi:long-chain fatty acid transport protein